jgi:hypothetical protein
MGCPSHPPWFELSNNIVLSSSPGFYYFMPVTLPVTCSQLQQVSAGFEVLRLWLGRMQLPPAFANFFLFVLFKPEDGGDK